MTMSVPLHHDLIATRPVALAVEPAPAMARLLRTMLESMGYELIEAAGPDEAFAAIENLAPNLDLVITEFCLPGINGHEIASFSQACSPDLRVVVLCDGFIPDGNLGEGIAFLHKPFTPAQLAVIIDTLRPAAIT